MDYSKSGKTVEESGANLKPLEFTLDLKEGIVFVPARQIGEANQPYVVVGVENDSLFCVRLSFHDESLAGTYDIIAEGYIIETWNAFVLPWDAGVKGYKKLPDSIIKAISEVRNAWVSGIEPVTEYQTGEDILLSVERLLFHEAELQANESLQRAWDNGIEEFRPEPLWKKPSHDVDISGAFGDTAGLSSLGKLSAAIFPPQYIVFTWNPEEDTPPPEVYIRDNGSAWLTVSDWKQVKDKKEWRFVSSTPEMATSVVVRIGETESLLELVPSEQRVTAETPLFVALYLASEKGEFDPATRMADDLREFRFSSLEKQALEYAKHLTHLSDQIGFVLTHALCSEILSQITRLSLFQWAEEKLRMMTMGSEGRTVFGSDILDKLKSFKEGGDTLTVWFYKAIYGIWHDELDKWKGQIDPSMYYEEEEIEEGVGKLLSRYESWQNRVLAAAASFSSAVSGRLADLKENIGAVWSQRISATSTPSFALASSQRPQHGMCPSNEDAENMLETIGIKNVEISDPDEWYGIFSHPEDEDKDMKEFLNSLSRVRADYYWGGLKMLRNGEVQFILDHVAERVPDIRDPEIELSAADDSLLLLIGVSTDKTSLKSAIEDLKKFKDSGGELERREIQEDSKPIVWINYFFTFNSQG